MSRWKYPFKSQREAKMYLRNAQNESGKPCFVRQVSVRAHVFKIFTSENEFKEYQMKKRKGNEH